MSPRHRGTNGHTLRAHREPKTQVFNIAASENRPVFREQCGPDGEPRIRRIRILPHIHRGLNQLFVLHRSTLALWLAELQHLCLIAHYENQRH